MARQQMKRHSAKGGFYLLTALLDSNRRGASKACGPVRGVKPRAYIVSALTISSMAERKRLKAAIPVGPATILTFVQAYANI